jgi:hypothetical protein
MSIATLSDVLYPEGFGFATISNVPPVPAEKIFQIPIIA